MLFIIDRYRNKWKVGEVVSFELDDAHDHDPPWETINRDWTIEVNKFDKKVIEILLATGHLYHQGQERLYTFGGKAQTEKFDIIMEVIAKGYLQTIVDTQLQATSGVPWPLEGDELELCFSKWFRV